MIVSILGYGWFGSALGTSLLEDGHIVNGSVTTSQKIEAYNGTDINVSLIKLGDAKLIDSTSNFWNCDALIIASNVKLAANPAYVDGLEQVIEIISSKDIKKTIFISSTSVYGEPDRFVDEVTSCKPETDSGEILLQLESLFLRLQKGRATSLRFGGLVGPGRLPGSFFAGKKNIANGGSPVNLIHLDDCIGITKRLLILEQLPACINAVAPDHPAKSEFYTLAAEVQHLPVPEFNPEKLHWKIVGSVYTAEIKYDYLIKDWKNWLHTLHV